ncbi:MAG TPA: cellulase family glycosylhydrolase [Acidimicrobiales bacterium]|nr:cellulase family glycosylhydrolase [Acidimicrobiales bacterium]
MSRSLARLLAGAATAGGIGLGLAQLGSTPSSAAATSPAVHVVGNHLVNSGGATVQLVGVNRSGTEYACVQGWGIFDGPSDAASVATIASWHVNAVRVPLNEDCWLGINGVPSAYSGGNYRNAISNYVSEINAAGMVAVLDLHWGAPGGQLATSQEQMPDADHAPAFWSSVAGTFANTPGVVFDVFNEPHDVSWSCWRDGCTLANGTAVAGMQSLVSAVRSAGATQPVMVEGLNWGGDLTGWLANEPSDPAHALVASAHIYNFSQCNTTTCWDSELGPVAASVPLVSGELGETDCTSSFINSYMPWADAHGVSYLAWTWDAGGGWSCSNGPALLNSYDGTPNVFGAGYQSHLAALAATAPPPVTTTVAPTTVAPTTTTTTTTTVAPAPTTTTTTVAPTTTTTLASSAVKYSAWLSSAWGTGAVADLHITNTGAVPFGSSAHPWTVSFSLPAGVTVSQMWNASLVSQSAGLVKATAPSYTLSLGPGASIDVGWVEQGGQPLPASVTVRIS